MAVRFDTSADYLYRTASLPAYNAITVTGWFYLSADATEAALPVMLNDADYSDFILLQKLGTDLVVGEDTNFSVIIAFPSVGSWFFLALTCAGTGTNNLKGYASVGGNALSVGQTTLASSFTPAKLSFSDSVGASVFFNGRVAAVKVWDAVLTQAEIEQERWQYLPNRLANLHLFSPFINTGGTSFLDISGNGRNWTEGGTVTDEDGPPISWKRGRSRILIPAAAGGASAVPANRGNLGIMVGMSKGIWLESDWLKPTGEN